MRKRNFSIPFCYSLKKTIITMIAMSLTIASISILININQSVNLYEVIRIAVFSILMSTLCSILLSLILSMAFYLNIKKIETEVNAMDDRDLLMKYREYISYYI